MHFDLAIEGLRVQTRLGWPEHERSNPQDIELDVYVAFACKPEACDSDELAGTLCYAELAEALRAYCTENSFRLIEHLAARLHQLVRSKLGAADAAYVRVRKLHPPIAGLQRGASFGFGDARP